MFEECRAIIAPLLISHSSNHRLLEISIHLACARRRWNEVLSHTESILARFPKSLDAHIYKAYAHREKGHIQMAWETLHHAKVTSTDPKATAIFFYNFACYACLLGRFNEAMSSLQKAFLLNATLREGARKDPDLHQLKQRIGVDGHRNNEAEASGSNNLASSSLDDS